MNHSRQITMAYVGTGWSFFLMISRLYNTTPLTIIPHERAERSTLLMLWIGLLSCP